jgi:hypothetical protein
MSGMGPPTLDQMRSAGTWAMASSNSVPRVTVCGSPVHACLNTTVSPGCTTTFRGKYDQNVLVNSSWSKSMSTVRTRPPPLHAESIVTTRTATMATTTPRERMSAALSPRAVQMR